jgi:hypothetical protein
MGDIYCILKYLTSLLFKKRDTNREYNKYAAWNH